MRQRRALLFPGERAGFACLDDVYGRRPRMLAGHPWALVLLWLGKKKERVCEKIACEAPAPPQKKAPRPPTPNGCCWNAAELPLPWT